MGPYGTIQHCVNETRCNNPQQQMEQSTIICLWDIQHLANYKSNLHNIYLITNHPDSTSLNKQYQKCIHITSQSLLIVMHNLKSYKHAQHIITSNTETNRSGYWNNPQPFNPFRLLETSTASCITVIDTCR